MNVNYREMVRKKAVMCLHHFQQRAPSLMQHANNMYRKALCDKDPSVMFAALQIYYDLVKVLSITKIITIRPRIINCLFPVTLPSTSTTSTSTDTAL